MGNRSVCRPALLASVREFPKVSSGVSRFGRLGIGCVRVQSPG
jgi:hypothetical protein